MSKKKEKVPWKGLLLLVAFSSIALYFWTTSNHSRKKEYYARITKEFPNSLIYQWSELEFTVIERATLISRKITFDGKGHEKIETPIQVIGK